MLLLLEIAVHICMHAFHLQPSILSLFFRIFNILWFGASLTTVSIWICPIRILENKSFCCGENMRYCRIDRCRTRAAVNFLIDLLVISVVVWFYLVVDLFLDQIFRFFVIIYVLILNKLLICVLIALHFTFLKYGILNLMANYKYWTTWKDEALFV